MKKGLRLIQSVLMYIPADESHTGQGLETPAYFSMAAQAVHYTSVSTSIACKDDFESQYSACLEICLRVCVVFHHAKAECQTLNFPMTHMQCFFYKSVPFHTPT